MKDEGKGLTDYALLFTAGTWAGLHAGAGQEITYALAAISFLAAVATGMIPAASGRKTGSWPGPGAVPHILRLSFFLTGLYSATVCRLSGGFPSDAESHWFLQKAAENSVQALKETILSVPFRDMESNAMILALVTGDKSRLSDGICESFRISGASHILALSGMHLGVVYIVLTRVFSILGNTPKAGWLRSAMIVSVSGYYTMMTGAGASIMRAFLFITLNETAKCTGRARPPMNIFSASLMTQAMLTPQELESVGFQLSYLAMAGIYLLYPRMKEWYKGPGTDGKASVPVRWTVRARPVKRLWDAAALSVSCQAFTAPAVWYYFGTFPPYFLITNLIAVPLSTAAINLSIPVIILSHLGICPEILVRADDLVICAMCRSLEIISGL